MKDMKEFEEAWDGSGLEIPEKSQPVEFETVKTSELSQGDVIFSHGMRLRCGEFEVSKSHGPALDGSQTRWCLGTVLNPDEVRAAKFVPESWWRHGWTIQGNDLARWIREVHKA